MREKVNTNEQICCKAANISFNLDMPISLCYNKQKKVFEIIRKGDKT